MLRMRLRRTGAKKKPSYRVVIADARAPRDGAFLEIVGHYNPRTEPSSVVINREKAELWLKRGAQPSERVTRLLVREGILDESKLPAAARSAAPAPEPEAKPAAKARATRTKAPAASEAAAPAATAEAAEAAEAPTES